MSFDLARFAREMLGLSGHDELLECARRTAAEAAHAPAFAAHVLPGRPWQQATLLSADADAPATPAPVRSALFALHRRLSLTTRTLRLERSADTEAIFKALLPDGPGALDVVPLQSRTGRLTGAIVAGRGGAADAAGALADLETIAALTGPAMESAWRNTLACRDQERLQVFSETTEETLWDLNVAQDEIWWGGNLELLFGARSSVSKRSDWRRTCVDPDDAARVLASFEQAFGSHASSWSAEYRLRTVAGGAVDVREHVYFLRDVDGRANRAIGTVRDVSALQQLLQREKSARAEAEQANIVKDDFLAMLGHELRNPLAPIVSVLNLLERRASGPDRQLEILRRQTQHLVRLVDDLLDVSRISTGKVELSRQRTPVDPLMNRALEMVAPLFEQRRHRLSVDVARDLCVDVDAARMTQVLSNLLANAAKYTEPGGHVQVGARAEDGQAVIRIRDDGIGISAEFLPVVFDMFSQGRQALDRAQGGLGLGLSIVKNIVKLHGGTVEAHSDGVGRGTEVVVRLALAGPAHAATADAMAEPGRPTRPRRLLIVDDNEDAALLLRELLVANGHAVRVASHPHDALAMFADDAPDVALLDIGLPALSGYELIRQLRALAGATRPSSSRSPATGWSRTRRRPARPASTRTSSSPRRSIAWSS